LLHLAERSAAHCTWTSAAAYRERRWSLSNSERSKDLLFHRLAARDHRRHDLQRLSFFVVELTNAALQ
jgi:hypothetical protein